MATTSFDSVWSLGATRVIVPIGATLAVFMQPQAGQVSTLLKMFSGGTCEILGPAFTQVAFNIFLGTTMAGGTLAALSGSGYCLSTNETLSLSGPAYYYLSSTGATSVLHAIFGKAEGQ